MISYPVPTAPSTSAFLPPSDVNCPRITTMRVENRLFSLYEYSCVFACKTDSSGQANFTAAPSALPREILYQRPNKPQPYRLQNPTWSCISELHSSSNDKLEEMAPSTTPPPSFRRSSSPKTQYLICYNLLSTILWLIVLGRVILLIPLVGTKHVYGGVGNFAKWTQTLALLEVVHSASGKGSRRCFAFGGRGPSRFPKGLTNFVGGWKGRDLV